MMVRCAALGCENDEESGVSLFPFPNKPKLKRKWEANIGRTDLAPSDAICELHFTDDDLAIKDGVKFMKADAIPSMFGSHTNKGESEAPIRRSGRTKTAPSKRGTVRKIPKKPLDNPKVEKEKPTSLQEKRANKKDSPRDGDCGKKEQQNKKPRKKSSNNSRKTGRLKRASSTESEDFPRKPKLVLDGADERGHAIAEWYLLDIFEATRLITTHLHSGTLITDNLVANVEETIIDVISKLLQRVSSVIITSMEEEFGVRSDIRKVLGKLDSDAPDAVKLLLQEDKEEIDQPDPAAKADDGYEETLRRLDSLRGDQKRNDVEEEVISPATDAEDCQVLLEHAYSKDVTEEQNEGARKNEKSEQELHCGFCGFKTVWKAKLRRHLHMKHLGGERTYSCPRCSYVSPSEEGLQKHFRTHTGSKPFPCTLCDFCTANKSNLNRHMMIHTGEKPFQCVYCSKTFRQKVSLTNHIKSHFRQMNEESQKEKNVYACGECGFVTIERNEWNDHKKVHREYKCGHCDFVTSEYADLKEHQVEHRGVPHVCGICSHKCHNADELRIHTETHEAGLDIVCNICGYRTTKKSYLNRHIASHMGDKPYKCEYCQAKFRTNGHLNIHVRRHEIGPYCKR